MNHFQGSGSVHVEPYVFQSSLHDIMISACQNHNPTFPISQKNHYHYKPPEVVMGHLGPAQGQCPGAQSGGCEFCAPPKKGPGSVAHF